MAEAARHPVYRRMMRRGILVAESGRKDLLVTMPNPRPISVVSSMKQQEVEELLRCVEKLEKAETWLLGEKEATENASWVAARGGRALVASVFFWIT
ncbi:hypothetical protein BDA96_10G184900 [Sorghum bicolor]|uniref:Uncharacterized protein n=1 Tax=Sorghum bicolor TaxID=4558 RepID=A0A921Q2R8_SORBI|nr:hypothetical protein BDA96_10G184900 [Sorghum bicolor]